QQQLDTSRLLLQRRHFRAALKHLEELERELNGTDAESKVWYRLFTQRAAALLYQSSSLAAEAEGPARRALEYEPEGAFALGLLTRICIALGRHDDAKRYAARAVAARGDDPGAWGALAEATVAAGEGEISAPTAI